MACRLRFSAALLGAVAAPTPLVAQLVPAGQGMVQPLPMSDADALAETVRRVASNPLDINALLSAGELSVRLGDLSAAGAFFARAEKIDPRNARAQAGKAAILVRSERPGEALRYFAQAEALGLDARRFAADRGLAYDLIGDQPRAQRDYRAALADHADDETRRRLALSLAISGRSADALRELTPLLRENDRAAWRTRAFVEAMGGDPAEASRIATTMMPPGTAAGLATFFARLPTLPPIDRAFAVHFGEVHATPERFADARLAPVLTPLPAEPVRVEVAAVVAPPAPTSDRRERRRRLKVGREALASTVPMVPALASTPAEPPAFRPPIAPTVAVAGATPRVGSGTTAHVLTGDELASLAAATSSRRSRRSKTEPALPANVELASLEHSVSPGGASTATTVQSPTVRAVPSPTLAAVQPVGTIPDRMSAAAGQGPLVPAASTGTTPGGAPAAVVAMVDPNRFRAVVPVSRSTPIPTDAAPPPSASSLAVSPASSLAAVDRQPAALTTSAVSPIGGVPSAPAPGLGAVAPTQLAVATTPLATADAGAATIATGAPGEITASQPPAIAPAPAPLPQPGFTSTGTVAATALAPLVIAPAAAVATPRLPRTPRVTSRSGRVEADSILARIVAGLTIPASELGVGATPAHAAKAADPSDDIATERPAVARGSTERKSADRAPVKEAPDRKAGADRASDKAVAKTVADRKAAAKQALADKEEADARKLAKTNPARIWVQVAGGANEGDLSKAWAAARKKAPGALGSRQGYATPLRATNRVLTGPFKTDAEARAAVNQLAREGLSAFTFTSDAGQPVTKLGQR